MSIMLVLSVRPCRLRHNLHTAVKLKGTAISRWKSSSFRFCVIKGGHKMKISDMISGGSRLAIRARIRLLELAIVFACKKIDIFENGQDQVQRNE